jgi:hypothetical protein
VSLWHQWNNGTLGTSTGSLDPSTFVLLPRDRHELQCCDRSAAVLSSSGGVKLASSDICLPCQVSQDARFTWLPICWHVTKVLRSTLYHMPATSLDGRHIGKISTAITTNTTDELCVAVFPKFNSINYLGASSVNILTPIRGSAILMDDWYDDDERSDGLALAEARSLKAKFYNLGTALRECAHRLFFDPFYMIPARSSSSQHFCSDSISAALHDDSDISLSCVCCKRLLFGDM